MRTLGLFRLVESLGKTFLIGLTVVLTALVGVYLPVKASAGHTTTISYVVDFITKMKAEVAVSWLVTAGVSRWAFMERRKRVEEREEKDRRITELEKQMDPNRTSSNLSPSGEKQNPGETDD